MQPVERALIAAFNTNPQDAHTTTQLVKTVYAQEYATIREDLASNDPTTQKQAKRTKAKLHRQLLYYLNKLIDKNVLEVADIKERGEKSYRLTISSGELILQDNKQTIAIRSAEQPTSYVVEAQEQKRIHQYTNALHHVEAYAINAKHYPGIAHLRADLNHLYAHIADALLIQNFHVHLTQDPQLLKEALQQLIVDSQDYNIAITLHIDLTEHQLTKQDQQFINTYALHHPKRVYLLFSADKKEIRKQHTQLAQAIQALANNQIKVNLHNQAVDQNTHFLGEAGAYKLDDKHTQLLKEQPGAIISTGSFAIDYAHNLQAHEITTLAHQAAKTLLERSTTQRRISARALTGLSTTGPLSKQLAKNNTYLRLWNYQQTEEYKELLTQLHEQIKNFCELESRIYSSCGVPIHFTIHLSTAFSHYAQLSTRSYTKKPVYERGHLKNQDLELREQLLRVYATDRVRIFREGNFDAQTLLSELLYLTDTYELPLITYDFKELQKTISLESFL